MKFQKQQMRGSEVLKSNDKKIRCEEKPRKDWIRCRQELIKKVKTNLNGTYIESFHEPI